MSEIVKRSASAAVILPCASALIWVGGYAFAGLLAAAVLIMLFEWQRIARAFSLSAPYRDLVMVSGCLVVLLTGYAAFDLRQNADGLDWVVWLVLVVVATDVGAYFTGRTLGGPKLAPRISPNKTWSGLLGGMLLAVLLVSLLMMGVGEGVSVLAVLATLVLSMLAQAGDLLESHCKRRANVKDSGRIIPGHGGFLDRFDGFLITVPALWLYHIIWPQEGLALHIPDWATRSF